MQRDENRRSGFFHSVSGQLTAFGIAVAVLVVRAENFGKRAV
jgi:hypothetical protein